MSSFDSLDSVFNSNGPFQTMTSAPRIFPSKELTDVQNRTVNVAALAAAYHLILITFKSAECPVCPQLLHILNMFGLDPNKTKYIDPFALEEYEIDPLRKKFCRLLLKKDAYFIIVCPGDRERVAAIQQATGFHDYPFIAGNQALELGRALKIAMSDTELWPATFEITKETLVTQEIHIGRGPGQYNHEQLIRKLIHKRCQAEWDGITMTEQATALMDLLRRKMNKCRNGQLAPSWTMALSPRPTAVVSSATTPDTTASEPTTHPPSSFQTLPTEILELVLSYFPDTRSLVVVAGVSRLYYMTVCSVLIHRLKTAADKLKTALPHWDSRLAEELGDVIRVDLDRWQEDPDGVGYRELEDRLRTLERLVVETSRWTRPTPRKSRQSKQRLHDTA